MPRGRLIVFEGVDGAGTTTQAARLHDRLQKKEIPAYRTAQPSERPVGKLIREVLGGRQIENPGFATMSLLFAADRQDQQDADILPRLYRGEHVICDRYVHSSVIYQSVTANDPAKRPWIKEINKHIIAPDITIYLRIDANSAEKRRAVRGGEPEIFDQKLFQRRLIDVYDSIGHIFPEHRIVTVDATQTIDEIESQVWQAVGPFIDPPKK
ncbi:MAG: dTMP kinase [Deltaproteobacteria bacterium]|nr:dTMP kinase [Deltaproteobacteria bacterium]